jgi:hypothetical protein
MSVLTDLWRRRGWRAGWTGTTPRTRRLLAVAGLLAAAVPACLIAGLPPGLPVVLAFLAFAALRPLPGLVYAMVVFVAPLGLWLTGVRAFVGAAFGGRDYALNLSAAVVVFALFAAVVRRHARLVTGRRLAVAAAAGVALAGWTLVGFAHHGVAQTLIGVRFAVLPPILLAVIASLGMPRILRLMDVLSWLVVANGIAAVGEVVVGPVRLAAWGFDNDRTIRYIDGTFRAPGLTEFNAALGMLAGAYLLGYVALWLIGQARPGRRSWHLGAGAAAICLALSTSRSGALLLAAGVVAAVVLNRSGGAARRRRARLFGLALIGCVAAGFVAVGATGATSLFQRFDIWSTLLSSHVPLYGRGFGAVGAASNSRLADGPQVFVDNYYVSVALQLGPVALVALLALIAYALVRLCRRSVDRPTDALHIAILAGLAGSFLVIEAWEYAGAMMCLALFVAYGLHLDRRA